MASEWRVEYPLTSIPTSNDRYLYLVSYIIIVLGGSYKQRRPLWSVASFLWWGWRTRSTGDSRFSASVSHIGSILFLCFNSLSRRIASKPRSFLHQEIQALFLWPLRMSICHLYKPWGSHSYLDQKWPWNWLGNGWDKKGDCLCNHRIWCSYFLSFYYWLSDKVLRFHSIPIL